MTEYFASTNRPLTGPNTDPRHPNPRAQRTARPCLRDQRQVLPRPAFQFSSFLDNPPARPILPLNKNSSHLALPNGDCVSVGGFALNTYG
jgi:hypothetical protein